MTEYLRISSYIRKPFLIFVFATAPLYFLTYEENFIFFSIGAKSLIPAVRMITCNQLWDTCLPEEGGCHETPAYQKREVVITTTPCQSREVVIMTSVYQKRISWRHKFTRRRRMSWDTCLQEEGHETPIYQKMKAIIRHQLTRRGRL